MPVILDRIIVFCLIYILITPSICKGDSQQALRTALLAGIKKRDRLDLLDSTKVTIGLYPIADPNKEVLKRFSKNNSKGSDKIMIDSLNTFTEFLFNGDSLLKKRYRGDELGIVGKNSHYYFGITRTDPQTKMYTVSFFERVNSVSNQSVEERINKEITKATEVPNAPWMLLGVHISDWLNRENFEILGISEVEDEGRKRVRLNFEHIIKEIRPQYYSLSDSFIIFDPEYEWAISSYSIVYNNAEGKKVSKSTSRSELGNLSNGLPVILKKTLTTQMLEDKKQYWEKVVLYDYSEDDVEPKEFYLSHYGLPEPNFEEPFLSTWMKYLLAGLVCLGIAYWIKRRRAVA